MLILIWWHSPPSLVTHPFQFWCASLTVLWCVSVCVWKKSSRRDDKLKGISRVSGKIIASCVFISAGPTWKHRAAAVRAQQNGSKHIAGVSDRNIFLYSGCIILSTCVLSRRRLLGIIFVYWHCGTNCNSYLTVTSVVCTNQNVADFFISYSYTHIHTQLLEYLLRDVVSY